MNRAWLLLAVLGLVGIPAFADGPETGIVQGTVSEASGSALPGVLVTLSGDRGERSGVTDASGQYRFAGIVPGNYNVKAVLEGFQEAAGEATVTAGRRTTIDLKLTLGTSEEITVTSEAPMVDKFSVTAGTTIQAEVGEQTAGTTRTYYGVINALPGVTADAQNDDIQQTRPSVNGTHFADQAVYIDGVDTTFAKFGGSRVYLPTTAVTEVSMEAGGSSAEYGRYIGSSTNVIVKSGTNRFHADALWQRQEVSWGADYDIQPSIADRQSVPYPTDWFQRCRGDERDNQRQTLTLGSGLTRQGCVGGDEEAGGSNGYEFSFGGPLAKDKAWFFVGWSDFDDAFQERLLGGDPYDVSLQNEARIFKFNFQPAQSHSLAASFIDTPAFRNYFDQTSFDYWVPTPHENDSELSTVNWNWSLSSNFFLETKIAQQESQENKFLACNSVDVQTCIDLKAQDRGPQAGHSATDVSAPSDLPLRFPSDPSQGTFWPGNNYNVYVDSENLGAWHNGWILSDGFGFNAFPRDQANIALTQFAGANHEIKYGIDYQSTKWEGDNSRTSFHSGFGFDALNPFGYVGAGGLGDDTCSLLRVVSTSPSNPDAFGRTTRGRSCVWVDYNSPLLSDPNVVGRGSGDAEMRDTGFYVRDRFTVGDHWTFNLGFRAELQEGFNDVRRQVVDDTYVDPRINATYDVKGDGKLLFSLSAGHYHAMLNQAWIAGGGGTAGGMHDLWNGYEGYEVWLFCDPIEALVFCPRPTRPDTIADGTAGLPLPGYNFPWSTLLPGRMWDAVDAGVFEHDLDTYYKEEIILGMEWQFARNWALDVKYIDWEIDDLMFSNTQIDQQGRNIFITANYKNLPEITRAMANAREAAGIDRLIDDATIDAIEPARNQYRGLQVQLNRRFQNGWSLYNNISWSETDTTGAGDWWNNTNSSYGENITAVLDETMILNCDASQAVPDRVTGRARTLPVDCNDALGSFLGQPVSTINRRGPNHAYDRSIIYNSFGFKTWTFGKQNFTLGGHFTYQTGTPWARNEGISIVNIDPNDPKGGTANDGVSLQLYQNGRRGGRTQDEYTINLSTAYGFPTGYKAVRGEIRVEVLNLTDQQRRRDWDGRGEVFPARRFFQRPRQVRASIKFGF